jgi:hypothetical protein
MSGDGNNDRSQSIGDLLKNLVELCRSESLSEKGLREIIGVHGFGGAPHNHNDPNNINNYPFFFHEACYNERVTEGILRCLLEYFPNAVRFADKRGRLPLHYICHNKHVTLSMVQLLIDAFPDSLSHEDNGGCMPLHSSCLNKNMDEEGGLEILKLLLKRYPESVRHAVI